MYYTIYQVKNLINSKIYIGKHQTEDLDDGYMGSGKHLKRAIKKYGIENFEKTVLFVYETEEEMNNKEKEIVTEDFCKRKDTYNICEGGKGGFGYINENGLNIGNLNNDGSETHKKRSSRSYLGWSDENREKNLMRMKEFASKNKFKKGCPYAEEMRKKARDRIRELKQANLIGKRYGDKNSAYGKMWVFNENGDKKFIRKDEYQEYVELGFTSKHIEKYKNPKFRVWVNNGVKNKLILYSDLKEYEKIGFTRGRFGDIKNKE